MQRLGDQLLAGAALAGDQHRRRRVGDPLDHREHAVHLGRVADQPEPAADVVGGRVQPGLGRGAVGRGLAHRLVDDRADLLLLERLLDVVEGAGLDRLDGVADRAVGGHHDDRHVRVGPHRGAQHLHAVEPRHPQVGDHDVDAVERGHRLGAVGGQHHVVAVALEDGGEDAPQVRFVVGHQDADGLGHVGGTVSHGGGGASPDAASCRRAGRTLTRCRAAGRPPACPRPARARRAAARAGWSSAR